MKNDKRIKFLIHLKVLYLTEFFDIHKIKKENLKKISRCDLLINKLILKQSKNK